VSEHLSASPTDVLDGALRDASVPTHTRRQLLEGAGVGAAGLTIGSLGAPASGALANAGNFGFGIGGAQQFGVFASTTEALTVTLLTELLRRAPFNSEVSKGVAAVFDGPTPPSSITGASSATTSARRRSDSGFPTPSSAALKTLSA
jgi:hypothetical protein